MCLGIPGRVVEIHVEHELLMGRVDFGGIVKNACLAHVPEVQVGQYVVVHVGFALTVMDEEEAHKVFAFLQGMDELSELEAGETS